MSEFTSSARARTIYVSQGEIAVEGSPDVVITAVLGSCIAVCLHDPKARVGGMNHILVPETGGDLHAEGAAVNAMEMLINAMIKAGAQKRNFVAKMFGGSQLTAGLGNIGERNATIVREFLQNEGIPLNGESVGGNAARRIEFRPHEGAARQRKVRDTPVEVVKPVATPTNDLELF